MGQVGGALDREGKPRGGGRPVGTGTGPGGAVRRRAVRVMLTEAQMAALVDMAWSRRKHVATLAYEILAQEVTRAREMAMFWYSWHPDGPE